MRVFSDSVIRRISKRRRVMRPMQVTVRRIKPSIAADRTPAKMALEKKLKPKCRAKAAAKAANTAGQRLSVIEAMPSWERGWRGDKSPDAPKGPKP